MFLAANGCRVKFRTAVEPYDSFANITSLILICPRLTPLLPETDAAEVPAPKSRRFPRLRGLTAVPMHRNHQHDLPKKGYDGQYTQQPGAVS